MAQKVAATAVATSAAPVVASRKVDMKTAPMSQKLMDIAKEKSTNLIVAVDIVDPKELLKVVLAVAPHICAVKLHLDIIEFGSDQAFSEFCAELASIKDTYNFLIIEDRKFADIGTIMALQIRRLPAFVDIVTAHGITGSASIAELDRCGKGLLLIHQLSSLNNLIDAKYSEQIVKMLPEHKNIVGVISQTSVPNYLTISPGINLEQQNDHAGQQYKQSTNADLFIVGRGIYQAKDLAAAAVKYKLYLQKPLPICSNNN